MKWNILQKSKNILAQLIFWNLIKKFSPTKSYTSDLNFNYLYAGYKVFSDICNASLILKERFPCFWSAYFIWVTFTVTNFTFKRHLQWYWGSSSPPCRTCTHYKQWFTINISISNPFRMSKIIHLPPFNSAYLKRILHTLRLKFQCEFMRTH